MGEQETQANVNDVDFFDEAFADMDAQMPSGLAEAIGYATTFEDARQTCIELAKLLGGIDGRKKVQDFKNKVIQVRNVCLDEKSKKEDVEQIGIDFQKWLKLYAEDNRIEIKALVK